MSNLDCPYCGCEGCIDFAGYDEDATPIYACSFCGEEFLASEVFSQWETPQPLFDTFILTDKGKSILAAARNENN